MPYPQASVEFPGLINIVSAEYVLNHGIRPGICRVVITPQRTIPVKPGVLVLRFGSTVLRFPDCIPDQASFDFNESGELWKLDIKDRRWKWALGHISGRYNLRMPNDTNLLEKVEVLQFKTEKKPEELLKLCLKEMGEKNVVIKAKLPKQLRPTVEWDYTNPAQALQELCDLLGLRIVLGLDNRLTICEAGKGATLPDGAIINEAGGTDPPEMPDEIIFVAGPTRFQIDTLLEAVGEDTDGRIKPIDDLSYKPAAGWGAPDPFYFKSLTDWRYIQLARRSVWRMYRLRDKPVTPGVDFQRIYGGAYLLDLSPGGVDLGGKTPGWGKNREHYLPIMDHQGVIVRDRISGLRKWMPALIYGSFVNAEAKDGNFQNNYTLGDNEIFPPRRFSVVDPYTGTTYTRGGDTAFTEGFTLDVEKGLVTFNRPVYRVDADNRPAQAVLILRTGCVVRRDEERTPHRWILRRKTKAKNKTKPFLVRDEELFLRVAPKSLLPNDDSERGDYDASLARIEIESNETDLKKWANELLDVAERQFQTLDTDSRVYAGWVAIQPDGAIQQVAWSLGQDGAFTRASRNDELAVPSTSYRERRFLENLALQKAAVGMASAAGFGLPLPYGKIYEQTKGTRIV